MFPGDPLKKDRKEDALLAMAWRSFLDDPEHDIAWIPRLPMVKAAYQVMRAVQEFTLQEGIQDEAPGWVVSGASKRGWTAFLAGAVNCKTCAAKIAGIAPIVPIVPDILADVHRQWQSYNGFTFAFQDYTDQNLTTELDNEVMAQMFKIADPINYVEQLSTIPKYVVVSSNDEFMSMDWTNLYWDKLKGEKHLIIVPNSEHSMATGIYQSLSAMGTFVRSLAAGKTSRPTFDY
jgi:PhoPQ-activated pathogenicity-related protein